MDLFQLLPGLFKEFHQVRKTIPSFLYPFSHESAERDVMAGQAGLEPATTGFGVRRSSQVELLTLVLLYSLTSRCRVWVRQKEQNFLKANLSVVVFRFFEFV